jgi:hypothetical protein
MIHHAPVIIYSKNFRELTELSYGTLWVSHRLTLATVG